MIDDPSQLNVLSCHVVHSALNIQYSKKFHLTLTQAFFYQRFTIFYLVI